MADELNEQTTQQDPPEQATADKLVPVAESIRYRRRAQQAEARQTELERELQELTGKLAGREEELAAAEAQRDEAHSRLLAAENRRNVERVLAEAGVIDVETAALLLSRRVNLEEEVEPKDLCRQVEQLLLDKPFLRAPAATATGKTASARTGGGRAAQIAQAAQRPVVTGNRRDIAEYLRLRRGAY